jgi:hypothetical protein
MCEECVMCEEVVMSEEVRMCEEAVMCREGVMCEGITAVFTSLPPGESCEGLGIHYCMMYWS